MSESSSIKTGTPRPCAALDSVSPRSEHIVLDSRKPCCVDGSERLLQVVIGHVDLFAVHMGATPDAGSRHHLFRAKSGETIVNIPSTGARPEPVRIIAVGGPETEVLVMPRIAVNDMALIETWLAHLSAAMIGTAVDWRMREAEPGSTCELAPGEQLRGPARGVAWISCERGELLFMGVEPALSVGGPPLPLASGAWVSSSGNTCVLVHGERPASEELWLSTDRFHLLAMECIRCRLAAQADVERGRLSDRANLADKTRLEFFNKLASVIAPRLRRAQHEEASVGRIFAVCRAVAEASGATIVYPPGRRLTHHDFDDVMAIARASRLRVRRTLLRPDWWHWDGGPLIAWRGEARHPVALIPTSRGYVVLEPGSPEYRVVNESLASELAPEAAMFYPKLPSLPLSAHDLLRFCTRHMRANPGRIVFAVLAMGALTLAVPLITQALVNSAIPRTEFDQLGYLTAALVVVAIATTLLQVMQGMAMLRLEGLLDWKLQAAVLDRLLKLPASFFRQYTVGDLANRTLGIDAVRRVVTGRVLRGLLASVSGMFSLLLMFYYDMKLALLATALMALRGLLIVAMSAMRIHHERRHFELRGKVEGIVLQLLTGVGKLRVASATTRALAVWARQFAAQKQHFIASQRAANVLRIVEAGFPTVATLIVFALAQGSSPNGLTLDLGTFLAFFAAFGQAMAAMGEWGTAIGNVLVAVPYFSRMRPLMATAVEISEDRKPPGELSGSFELSKVSFRYVPGGPPILEDISMRAAAGEYVAMVGPSGSGKSTIFRLLLGFERPESGAIFFDGKAVDTLDISAVRRQIGVVLQNASPMSGSIYDNICGGVQFPLELVWETARLVGLDKDIEAMPMGMHTVISEGVSTLSGGQRQRLMIARALIRRPRILLFDEATSSLDNQTQSIVSASLAKLNVTRIIIAHRLSTVRHADRIVVLVGGKLTQSGTFEELSAIPGVFADFTKRQLL